MKKIILLIPTLLLIISHVTGQSDSFGSSSETIKEIEKLTKEMKEIKNLLEEMRDSTVSLGQFCMKTHLVTIHDDNSYIQERANIDSITIKTTDGFISDIMVVIGINTFTNKKAPIGITKNRLYNNKDKLYANDNSRYLFLNEVLDYYSKSTQYAPDDNYLVMTKGTPCVNYSRGVSLHSVIDLRLYTDALALVGREPSGIVQFDARTRWNLHVSNIPDKGLYFIRYIKVNVNIAKLENKDRFIDTSTYSRSALLQRSWFKADLGINIFESFLRKNSDVRFYADAGISMATSDFRIINTSESIDSTIPDNVVITKTKDTIIRTIITPNWYIEGGVMVRAAPNAGFLFSGRFIWNYSTQTYGVQNDNNTNHVFFNPCVEGYYHLFGNVKNKIFGKLNYWIDTKTKADNDNHFFQLQLGYSMILTDTKKG